MFKTSDKFRGVKTDYLEFLVKYSIQKIEELEKQLSDTKTSLLEAKEELSRRNNE